MNTQTFLSYAQGQKEQWLDWLETIVNIDSGSRDLDGLVLMHDFLKQRWTALEFQTETIKTETGPQLVSKHLSSKADAPTLLMIGHTDTVFDRGTVAKRPFTIHDGRAYGPGVADMKGGLIAMLGVVETLNASDLLDQLNLIVVNNCDEEIGSICSRSQIEALAEEADWAFVFEPGRANGDIVLARKGGQAWTLDIQGSAAHAGVNPQDGASAIEAMSRKVIALHELSDYENGISVNVGVIHGGTRSNVVAEYTTAEIDARVPTLEADKRIKKAIEAIASTVEVQGTSSTLKFLNGRGPMEANSWNQSIFEMMEETAKDLGFDLGWQATGGGSDGNFTAAKGVPTMDGLGPVGGGYHSDEEYLEVDTLPLRVAMVASVIVQLAQPS